MGFQVLRHLLLSSFAGLVNPLWVLTAGSTVAGVRCSIKGGRQHFGRHFGRDLFTCRADIAGGRSPEWSISSGECFFGLFDTGSNCLIRLPSAFAMRRLASRPEIIGFSM